MRQAPLPSKPPSRFLTTHNTHTHTYTCDRLPCIDLPSVRITAAFHLTTRKGHLAFANGVKTSEAPLPLEQQDDGGGVEGAWTGERTLTVWRMDFPCPSYLLCVAAGEMIVVADDSPEAKQLMPDCPIAYLAPRNVDPDLLRHAFGPTPRMLYWLSNKLGAPFPFPKYYQVK